MALSDIDRSAVLRAITEFNQQGREAFLKRYGFCQARSYFLYHEEKHYDSKAIIGVAHRFARPREGALKPSDFNGGEATVTRILETLGFEMRSVNPGTGENVHDQLVSNLSGFWWVNHKQTYSQEVKGHYLWSPVTRSDGGRNEFYENMKYVRPGDIIFSFASAQIRAVGICTAPAILMPKPAEFGAVGEVWQNEGWRVSVNFKTLETLIRPKDHMSVLAPTLPEKYSPIRKTGDGNQGAYLAAVPTEMATALKQLLGPQWTQLDLRSELDLEDFAAASDLSEYVAEQAIQNRTNIGNTEKLQLIQSRRGQGVYRNNLKGLERNCRVTGTSNPLHLRASHIKPWRFSDDFEKLDGNNGLLLSPHIDHLFDQGYISFRDGGDMLISDHTDLVTLKRWQIQAGTNCGAFREAQLPYLSFHRKIIFKR